MSTLRILHDAQAIEAHKALRAHVTAANRARGLQFSDRPLAVFRWDDVTNTMIAGACGLVCPGWLNLELLWVEVPHRGQGIAAALLEDIEDEAVQLGAHSAYLWTQEFEAPGFYYKYGYREFAQLDEFMRGHQLIGMKKKLV